MISVGHDCESAGFDIVSDSPIHRACGVDTCFAQHAQGFSHSIALDTNQGEWWRTIVDCTTLRTTDLGIGRIPQRIRRLFDSFWEH